MDTILSLKNQIDKTNKDIISLLIQRQELSRELRNEKIKLGIPIYEYSRDTDIYTSTKKSNPNEYTYLKPILEEIMKQSRLIQN
jgi:chorismate mutase